MDVEITPEPTPGEREALVRGLERLLAGRRTVEPPSYRSPWRRAAIREGTGAPHRSSRLEP
jgi:hypothetical protein